MSYLFLILILLISLGLTTSSVDGGTNIIEFKKKYVTNSPDVCGDKLCEEESKDTSASIGKNLTYSYGTIQSWYPCIPNNV